MKKHLKMLAFASVLALLFTSCKKDLEEPAQEISDSELAEIKSLGFSTQGVQKVEEGYLVEGDIILTANDLKTRPTSPFMIIAKEEQYRTFNLVNPAEHPTIRVKLNNTSSTHQNAFSAALDEAIARYNAQGLRIKLQRANNRAHITVNSYYEVSNVLGSAGFPDADGDPYPTIKMNTYHYNTTTSSTNVNYIATIMAHEIGHCIGFRHTDYMDRSYSCGGSYYNEGSGTIGAVHIPGTPTTADAASWMLSCVARDVNRPFNSNDKIALSYLYK